MLGEAADDVDRCFPALDDVFVEVTTPPFDTRGGAGAAGGTALVQNRFA